MIVYNFCGGCGIKLTPGNKVDVTGLEMFCHLCYSKVKPKTVCVDFDGVLSEYTGWKGAECCGPPIKGAIEFIINLYDLGYQIVIFSTRDAEIIKKWLIKYNVAGRIHDVTNIKILAIAYIDDRNIIFRGSFSDILTDLENFKPCWKV